MDTDDLTPPTVAGEFRARTEKSMATILPVFELAALFNTELEASSLERVEEKRR